jgi:hypothetical protein
MTNDPLSPPSPDSQRPPSKGLAEVLEEARADIFNRLEKYSFDCSLDIHAEEAKECIERIFFRYPEIFIRNYASLDPERRNSLAKERRFQIGAGIQEAIHLDVEACSKLVQTIFRTSAVKHFRGFHFFSNIFDYEWLVLRSTKLVREITDAETEKIHQIAKGELNRLGFNIVDKEVEKASLNALKKIRDRAEEFKSFKGIPDDKKIEDLNKIASHDVEIFDAFTRGIEFEEFIQQKAKTLQKKGEIFSHQPKQEKAVQPPDLSKIPLWRGRDLDGRALDYLKTHYGQYLSAFGAEQNNVFQDQIRAHDPKLMRGVGNQLQEEGKGRKVRDFVKPRSARTELELETFDLDTLKKAHRIKGFLRRRRLKGSDT